MCHLRLRTQTGRTETEKEAVREEVVDRLACMSDGQTMLKNTMGPNNIKWWKCNDEMMVEYMERVRRKYEELDAEKATVEGEWGQYNEAFVGVAGERYVAERRKAVHREAETKDGGLKRWRRQWGRSEKHGRW